jgi:hypothetical protein
VLRRNGKPLSEGEVTLIPQPGPGERRTSSREYPRGDLKDAKGVFTLSGLAPGTYAPLVIAPGGWVAHAAAFTLAEGETKTLRLVAEPGASIAGRVVDDATGAPVAAVQVRAMLPAWPEVLGRTNEDGTFLLEGIVPAPKVRVVAFLQGRGARVDLEVPRPGVRVQAGTMRLEALTPAATR